MRVRFSSSIPAGQNGASPTNSSPRVARRLPEWTSRMPVNGSSTGRPATAKSRCLGRDHVARGRSRPQRKLERESMSETIRGPCLPSIYSVFPARGFGRDAPDPPSGSSCSISTDREL